MLVFVEGGKPEYPTAIKFVNLDVNETKFQLYFYRKKIALKCKRGKESLT